MTQKAVEFRKSFLDENHEIENYESLKFIFRTNDSVKKIDSCPKL